jgi:hypothetical protein
LSGYVSQRIAHWQTQIQPAGSFDQLVVTGQEPTGPCVQGAGNVQGILRRKSARTLQFMRPDPNRFRGIHPVRACPTQAGYFHPADRRIRNRIFTGLPLLKVKFDPSCNGIC